MMMHKLLIAVVLFGFFTFCRADLLDYFQKDIEVPCKKFESWEALKHSVINDLETRKKVVIGLMRYYPQAFFPITLVTYKKHVPIEYVILKDVYELNTYIEGFKPDVAEVKTYLVTKPPILTYKGWNVCGTATRHWPVQEVINVFSEGKIRFQYMLVMLFFYKLKQCLKADGTFAKPVRDVESSVLTGVDEKRGSSASREGMVVTYNNFKDACKVGLGEDVKATASDMSIEKEVIQLLHEMPELLRAHIYQLNSVDFDHFLVKILKGFWYNPFQSSFLTIIPLLFLISPWTAAGFKASSAVVVQAAAACTALKYYCGLD